MTSDGNHDIAPGYIQSSENDLDDENDEEFVDSNDDGESDEDDGNDNNRRRIIQNESEDYHDKKRLEDSIILQGSLYVNEEGRYIYSGTWTIERDVIEGKPQKRDAKDEKREDDKSNIKEKKKRKFKLKSKKQLHDESEGGSSQPAKTTLNLLTGGGNDDGGETREKPQSILFDGFFVTDETDAIQPHRKVKERDVEITFSRISNPPTRCTTNSSKDNGPMSKRRYQVDGRGGNEFGAFSIEGTYTPSQQHDEENNGKVGGRSIAHSLTCRKWYTPIIKPKKCHRGGDEYESDDDYEISGDEPDFEEVIGLQSEAGLSIEELRKKYYGGRESISEEVGNKGTANKRIKMMEDDDDDGCGF